MAVPINDTAAYQQYTATASQTVFSVPFEFFANSDLLVYKNATLLTLTTHYTVTGAGADGGGSITLVTGATAGDVVTVLRDVPVARTTDFPVSGPFEIESLNTELARITAMIQQLETRISQRVLRLQDYDTPESVSTLPAASARADKILAFGSAGDVELTDEATLSAAAIAATETIRDATESLYNQTATAIELANVAPLLKLEVDYTEGAGPTYTINQTLFEASQASGVRLNTAGTDDAVKLRLVGTSGRLTNGPTGHETYWNSVLGLGFNIDTVFSPVNATMPACSFRIETKFAQGGASDIFASEYHLPEHLPVMDGGGAQVTWRPISVFTPHKHTQRWNIQNAVSFQAVTVAEQDPDQGLRRQTTFAQGGASTVEHAVVGGQAFQYIFRKNNAAHIRVQNAANNALIDADYLDSQDRWRRAGPSYESGATPAVSVNSEAYGHGRYFRESLDSAPAAGGGWAYHIPNASITGSYSGVHMQGFSCSGTLYPLKAHNTHATGGVLTRQESSGGKNGIAFVDQSVSSTHYFVGRNASGQFVIANDNLDLEGTANPVITIKPHDGTRSPLLLSLTSIQNFADDAAASAGGVAIGQVYRNGSTLCIRVA